MVDLKNLETFLWVSRLGSFRLAAEKLHTTQPAVSQRIAALEAALGVQLLERRTARVLTTAEGRAALDYAERMLALRTELLVSVADRTALRGVVRLGVSETIVHAWLSQLVADLAEAHPRLSIEIEVDVTPRLHDALLAQRLDLAFMVGPPASGALRAVPLCTYPVAFVAKPGLDWPRRPIPIADLARHPVMTFSRATTPYAAVAQMLAQPGGPPVRLHATSSLTTATRLAQKGLCIAAIPPAIVAPEIARGALEILHAAVVLPDLHFVAAWLAGSETAITDRVVERARAAAAARPQGGVERYDP